MIILFALILVIALLIFASAKYQFHPFLSLLLAAVTMGFIGGLNEAEIIDNLLNGFGKTLGSIGIIIAFGTIIGGYLEKSGGAKTMADSVLKVIGERKSPLAMNITGFIVSIPVFCDSGFVILSSLNKALSKRTGIPLTVLAIALSTGLYATHVFVPPTPGPLAAAATLGADIGLVLILGIIVAIPSSLAGLMWAKYSGNKHKSNLENEIIEESYSELPSKVNSFAPILVPIILIALKSIAEYPTQPFGEATVQSIFSFLGNPLIALFLGVFISFSLKRKIKDSHANWISDGLKNAGVIILITGAGGAFGNVLRATDLGEYIGDTFASLNAGIILPFIIAALLKTAQGSSTVAIITTAAIISPLVGLLGIESEIAKALAVLSIGAGAMTVSHLNDSYFWVVSQFSGLDTPTALKTHTLATLMQGIFAIIMIFLLSLLFI
jgi:GntP family gluconate:H+ symporter